MRRWTSVVVVVCACSRPSADEERLAKLEERVVDLSLRIDDIKRQHDVAAVVTDTRFDVAERWLDPMGNMGLVDDPKTMNGGWWCTTQCRRDKAECEKVNGQDCHYRRVAWCSPGRCYSSYLGCMLMAGPGVTCLGYE